MSVDPACPSGNPRSLGGRLRQGRRSIFLTKRGARKIADRLPQDELLERLWMEAAAASDALTEAIEIAPDGADLKALPEWEDFRVKRSAFTDEVERRVFVRV